MNAKILIVDDSATDRLIISNILKDCELFTACDGLEAMAILMKQEIDLIILDLNMPRMNGFQVLEELKHSMILSAIPVIILTNYDETENEIKGLSLGALDYVRKPLNLESLRKRIEIHISIKNTQKMIKKRKDDLEKIVLERTKELILTRDITIHALTNLLEVRNLESSNHCKRMQMMVRAFCQHLSKKPEFEKILTEEYLDELYKTSPLHDIGKVGIPDCILLKPGRLNEEEFEIMKKHTTYGMEALNYDAGIIDIPSFIKRAIEVAATYHEWYNGGGYPSGLQGKDIPLSGRIVAIIDVYDALTSKRVYKPAISHEKAMEIIKGESGTHFDAELVGYFMEIEEEIIHISKDFTPDN